MAIKLSVAVNNSSKAKNTYNNVENNKTQARSEKEEPIALRIYKGQRSEGGYQIYARTDALRPARRYSSRFSVFPRWVFLSLFHLPPFVFALSFSLLLLHC